MERGTVGQQRSDHRQRGLVVGVVAVGDKAALVVDIGDHSEVEGPLADAGVPPEGVGTKFGHGAGQGCEESLNLGDLSVGGVVLPAEERDVSKSHGTTLPGGPGDTPVLTTGRASTGHAAEDDGSRTSGDRAQGRGTAPGAGLEVVHAAARAFMSAPFPHDPVRVPHVPR